MPTLTLGAAGVVTAFNGLPELHVQFVPDATEALPVPLTEGESDPSSTEGVTNPEKVIKPQLASPAPNTRHLNRATTLNAWFQASSGNIEEFGQEEIVRLHVIFMDSEHSVTGRISALSGPLDSIGIDGHPLMVNFLRDGAIVHQTPLQPGGIFTATGLERGPYGLAVVGPSNILAYSVYLGDEEDLIAAGYNEQQIADIYEIAHHEKMQIDSVGIAATDYPMARELIMQYANMNFSERVPARQHGTLDIPEGVDFVRAKHGTTFDNHVVRLMPDGSLMGRVRKPVDQPNGKVGIVEVPGVELIFLQNNAAIATTVTAEDGSFIIPQMNTGNYSLIARSMDGMAALGISILPSQLAKVGQIGQSQDDQLFSQTTGAEGVATMPVLFQEEKEIDLNVDLSLDIGLTDDLGILFNEPIIEAEPLESVAAAGGVGGIGGGAGGGAAAGGGGLLGGLLLGGALGAAIGSIGDDDGGGGGDPTPEEPGVTPDLP